MLGKRVILALISIVVGVVVTTLITFLVDSSPGEYGTIYFTFTSLFLACALAIWLDKLMGTDILPK